MVIGRVVGTVVTTVSHPHYKGRRLLVVQPLAPAGDPNPETGDFLALDNSQAGIGDTVLVNREGSGARQVLQNPDACIISVIVGIVDSTHFSAGA
jgi:ethanolamine utilization protein EutN